MKFKPRRSEEPEINVVSLIDVVLLLVVFFMLSSNFTAEGRLRIKLPQASTLPAQRPADTLRSAILKTVADSSRSAAVTIRADGRASHQSVVTAMDVLGRLGFTQMNVATVNEPGAAPP
jgi:biopolymer transport protein ExbD